MSVKLVIFVRKWTKFDNINIFDHQKNLVWTASYQRKIKMSNFTNSLYICLESIIKWRRERRYDKKLDISLRRHAGNRSKLPISRFPIVNFTGLKTGRQPEILPN